MDPGTFLELGDADATESAEVGGPADLSASTLRFSEWQAWAAAKCDVSAEIAWMYFETFHAVATPNADRAAALEAIWNISRKSEGQASDRFAESLARARGAALVPRIEFQLFLYIQRFGGQSLRQRVVDDKLPSPNKKLQYSTPESQSLDFVTKHMTNLLQLVMDSSTPPGHPKKFVGMRAFRAMNFLVAGDNASKVEEVCTHLDNATDTGYSARRASFSYSLLSSWLAKTLTEVKPQAITADADELDEAVTRLVTGEMLVNGASRRTIHLEGKVNAGNCGCLLTVERSHSATLYFGAPFGNVTISECRNTTVVLGPVAGTVVLSKCRNVTVSVACQRLVTNTCDGCTVYCRLPTRPVLQEAIRNLVLAPLGSSYPNGTDEGHGVDLWDTPLVLISSGPYSCTFSLMREEDFYPIEIPFERQATSQQLPIRYRIVTEAKESRVRDLGKVMQDPGIDLDTRMQFAEQLNSRFLEWIEAVGATRQLEELVQLDLES